MKTEVKKGKNVFVGLSGGVDSSVAAALLKQEGYEVTGVYMKNWSKDVGTHHCPWKEDLASARSVAAHLQIPFKVYDFEKQYFDHVTKYMLDAYKKGLTPNPDVMCNEKIKFEVFLQKCLDDGADMIATGHYARLQKGRLQVAIDANKDQTYFLYRIDPSVANKILFPIGEYTKPQVRKLAEKFNLPTATRLDSQGLCFVGNVPMCDFLAEFIKPKSGDIVDEEGKVIGTHSGAFSYTIGQRHGLGVGGGLPYFVYDIDAAKNIVHVTSDESSALLNKNEFIIRDSIWWDESMAKEESFRAEVRVRYRSKTVACVINKVSADKFQIQLDRTERAIAPGQSAVIYSGDLVVGGGIIQ